MNRKIVLKSVLFIAVVGFVLGFSSCNKEEKKVIGEWKYKKAEVKELTCSSVVWSNAIKVGFSKGSALFADEYDGIIEFTKKGNVIHHRTNEKEDGKYKYKINDNQLVITVDGEFVPLNCVLTETKESVTYEYAVTDKETMYWYVDIYETYAWMWGEIVPEGVEITKFIAKLTFTKQ